MNNVSTFIRTPRTPHILLFLLSHTLCCLSNSWVWFLQSLLQIDISNYKYRKTTFSEMTTSRGNHALNWKLSQLPRDIQGNDLERTFNYHINKTA